MTGFGSLVGCAQPSSNRHPAAHLPQLHLSVFLSSPDSEADS